MWSQFTDPANKTSNGSERPLAALPVDGKTLADAFLRRIELSLDSRLYLIKRQGKYVPYLWKEFFQSVVGVFASLRTYGIESGDRVCIFSNSRPEWCIADMATLCLGAMSVPLYQSSSPEDIAYILEHCGAKVVFVEDEALCRRLVPVLRQLGRKLPLVVFSNQAVDIEGVEITTFDSFQRVADFAAAEADLRRSAATIQPNTPASIVYTSGTTGRPKGAVLLHSNFAAELRSVIQEMHLTSDQVTLTFLPFAHIFGRVESYLPVFAGLTLGFAESISTVSQDLQILKPHLLLSVPRIYEKIYAKILNDVENAQASRKAIFHWALRIGAEYTRLLSQKKRVPLSLALKYKAADRLVFSKVREKLGGRLEITVSGGAPLAPELCQFFHACGVKVMEGYGLTETTAAVAVNRLDDYAFGTVGKPVADTEVRIAPDGEIQLRGPVIFKEYFHNPEATAEVLTPDGWFCTGDIGEITARGMLKITDRKKELIVTSGGKNIAPQKLENRIKASRYLSNGMVYGDKRKYLVALVTLNDGAVREWAKGQGLSFTSPDEMASHPEIRRLVENEFRQVNDGLASYESIKKFRVLPSDFTIETGELTPSLKLKRKVVTAKFQKEIEELY